MTITNTYTHLHIHTPTHTNPIPKYPSTHANTEFLSRTPPHTHIHTGTHYYNDPVVQSKLNFCSPIRAGGCIARMAFFFFAV